MDELAKYNVIREAKLRAVQYTEIRAAQVITDQSVA